MRLNSRERSGTGIVLQAGAVLIILTVAPAVSSAGHTRMNLAVEMPVTNHPRVEDPEDLVPLTVVLAHAPVGNLKLLVKLYRFLVRRTNNAKLGLGLGILHVLRELKAYKE